MEKNTVERRKVNCFILWSQPRQYVRRPPNTEYKSQYTQQIVKYDMT